MKMAVICKHGRVDTTFIWDYFMLAPLDAQPRGGHLEGRIMLGFR